MEVTENTKDCETPGNVVIVKTLKAARRLYTRLLSQIQADEIDPAKAKLLIYAISNYIPLYEKSELEERINNLENTVKERND